MFVEFLDDVDNIEVEIPELEKKMTNITNLYNVAQQFDVHVCETDMALYKSLFPQFRQLKVIHNTTPTHLLRNPIIKISSVPPTVIH